MQFHLLKGNTGYIHDETNIGVYIFPDLTCLLVDSGTHANQARQYLDLLQKEGLRVKAILNTHAHADHCGGNAYLQAATDCGIYAASMEALYIENPLLTPLTLYSAIPPRVLKNRFLMPDASQVTARLEAGQWDLGGESFRIIPLAGHSLGQVGLITPDGVAFIGDSLMSDTAMENFAFVYVVDPGQMFTSFETLRRLEPEIEISIPGHGEAIRELTASIDKNEERLTTIASYVSEELSEGMSREVLLEKTIRDFNLQVNSSQYYLLLSSISAFLSFLISRHQVQSIVKNGQIIYKKSRSGKA